MWLLMKYEYKKLFSSHIQKVLVFLICILPIFYACLLIDKQEIKEQQTYYTPIQGDMDAQWFHDRQKKLAEGGEGNENAVALRMTLLEPYTIGNIWTGNKDFQTIDQETTENILALDNEQYPAFVIKEMNQISTFQFGPYFHWDLLMNMMSAFGVLFAIYLTITVAPMISAEYSVDMMDVIKTSKKGKKKIIISKLLCALSIAIILPILVITSYVFYIWLRYGLANGNVTIAVYQLVNPYTFQEAVTYSILMIILGSVAICAMTFFLSTLFKNSYVALSVSLVLLLFPLFFFIDVGGCKLSQFFPIFFMITTNVCLHFPFITLQSVTMYYKDFLLLMWIPCSVLLLGGSIYKYQHSHEGGFQWN